MNFIICGLHQVQVFAPGTTPGGVLAAALAGGTISVAGVTPPVVDVSYGRVYRGIVNPAVPDGVEAVHFPAGGTYRDLPDPVAPSGRHVRLKVTR